MDPRSSSRPAAPNDGLQDHDVDFVVEWLGAHIRGHRKDPVWFFGDIVRQSVDEVIDGPRTGRWQIEQLEKTESTYVGTKVEIVTRTALGLERAYPMDLDIDGRPVDIKWSKSSVWQIPKEAIGHVCLCIGGDSSKVRTMTRFKVGVVRCRQEYLNPGTGQGDKKRTLSLVGRRAMRMLVDDASLPANFIAEMDPAIREFVMAQRSGQERVRALFQAMPNVPISRLAIQTVARQPGDPFRRTRVDKWRGDTLGGIKALNGKQQGRVIAALGLGKIAADEWIAVPLADFQRVRADGSAT